MSIIWRPGDRNVVQLFLPFLLEKFKNPVFQKIVHVFFLMQERENISSMKTFGTSETPGVKVGSNRGTLRKTLRRRVSMTVMRQKMKKLQDYSLPCQTDNFRFLRAISDYCNSPVLGLRRGRSRKVKSISSTFVFPEQLPIIYFSQQSKELLY